MKSLIALILTGIIFSASGQSALRPGLQSFASKWLTNEKSEMVTRPENALPVLNSGFQLFL
jgi:hypothetical protein